MGLFLLALAVRLPALGQFLTPDEFLWADRSRNFLAGLLDPAYVCESPANHTGFAQAVGLACTLRTGHPGVTTMWTGGLGILLRYLADGAPGRLFDYTLAVETNPLDARFIAPLRLPTVVLTSLWVAGMFWLVWRLFGDRRVALAAALLLALDPFHAAFSRVIHHDALSTSFMTLSLLTALIYWSQTTSRRWLVVSGILAGFAFLSKSPSLFLNPMIALIGLWTLLSRRLHGEAVARRDVARTLGDGLLWFGCAAAVFVLFWPAMWVIPVDVLRTVFVVGSRYASGGHAKGNYFLGSISQDPGALFYPVTWLLRSSPLTWLGLAALAAGWLHRRFGAAAGRRDGGSSHSHLAIMTPAGVLLVYVLLYVAFMTVGEKKQERCILPIFPILNTLAAVGLVRALSWRASRPALPSLRAPLLLLFPAILLVQGMLVAASYPYYLTSYNPLLGGIRGAERITTIGWGEGLDLAADYLNQKPNAENLRVSAWYQSTFAPFFRGEAISYSQEKGKAMAGDYVIFYINQWQRRFPDEEMFRYFETRYEPEVVISLQGIDYVMIYPGPGIQHYVEDRVEETRRTYRGIAALLGWDWPGAQDPDRPVATPGDALPFRLYWEYLGKVPEERFFFRLVGSDGRTWAEDLSQPVPSENGDPASWRQGQIITEAGELRLPPGTPPGEYRLEIGFYTQAPAVTAGELIFAVPPEDARVHVAGAAPGQASPALPVPHRPAVDLAELRLLGASEREARLIPEEAWTADVYWQAASAPQGDYQARLSLVDAEGQTRWIWGAQPLVAFYPTSHWQPGQVIRSQMTITPTLRTPGGDFDLTMTLLDERGQPVDRTRLGPARVEGRVRAFNLPPVAVRLDVTFGDAIELVGFNEEPPLSRLRPGDEVALALVWRALAPLEADYVVTVQLLGPDGGVYGQRDASPLEGAAPTSTWSPGEILVDEYRFAVSSDAPPGEYRLLVAMYRPESGERLPVGDGGDSLTLASIEVTQ